MIAKRIPPRAESAGGASLEGAEFRVTSTPPAGHSRNQRGSVVFDAVPLGSIVVTETKAPAGYKQSSYTYTVGADQLGDAEVITLEPDDFIEHVIAFDIDIVKYRDTGAEGSGLQHAGPGIRFEIISNTTGKTVGSLITDENGKASTDRAETVNREAIAADKRMTRRNPDGRGKRVEAYPARSLMMPRAIRSAKILPPHLRAIVPVPVGHRRGRHGGQGEPYIVDNDLITSYQVVKADAESGQTVPLAGFPTLGQRSQAYYPKFGIPTTEVSIFETDDEDRHVSRKHSGRERIIREVAAREPYLLPNKDVKVVERHETGPVTVVVWRTSWGYIHPQDLL
ncbi:MAG: collagen binding domain-containing protein [Collinsella aerofaciens]